MATIRTAQSRSLNPYLLRSSLVAALGGMLFGFDTAVIAGTTRALTETYSLTPAMLGFTVSSALWGTVLGSIFAAAPSDRYGRRVSEFGDPAAAVNNDDDGMRPSTGRDPQLAELQRAGTVSNVGGVGDGKVQELVRGSLLSQERGEDKQGKGGLAHTFSVYRPLIQRST